MKFWFAPEEFEGAGMPKKWTPGEADEPWKVLVCAEQHLEAKRTVQTLVYVLTDCGSDTERGLAEVRQMAGEQIVKGLTDYSNSCLRSVEAGIGKSKET